MGNPDLDSYFDAVYAETFNSVSKFVVSHAARFQDSEDIIQNVYTRFYKRISEKGFADIESAEAFLINIAKFECRSVFSGFMRRKERDVILSEIDEEQSAAFEAEMSRDQKLLEDVMADKILAKQIFDDIMSGDETWARASSRERPSSISASASRLAMPQAASPAPKKRNF